jgi:protein-S-isoprenylcysteine O-methyltransferase Ste14
VFALLTRKPNGRLFAILLGGVGLPVVGVVSLVVFAIHGGQAGDPPAWFVVLFCLVFVLGGIWHWWALTRPAVRQWCASSQAKALPAEEEGPQSGGEKGNIVN